MTTALKVDSQFARRLTRFSERQFTTCLVATTEIAAETQISVTIMLGASISSRIREAAGRFGGANQGNIAVIFAIALVPVLSFVGAAIDYSRANNARSSMQAALDSTALMLSKDLSSGIITTNQITTKAQSYFTALYHNMEAQSISISATYTVANGSLGSTIMVNGSGSIPTDFMQVVGFPTLNFNTTSTTAWGNTRMRVAMALDNTGSMAQDGKIGALQTASKNLIDQLSALAKTPGDVYISIVPFAKVVNVNSSNYGQSWIDWTDWQNPPTLQPNNGNVQAALPNNWHAVGPGVVCPFTNGNGGFVCTTGPANGSATSQSGNKNVIPSSGTYSGYICPSVDYNSHSLYNGCWDSTSTGNTEAFCSGSSTCSCPLLPNNNPVGGCSCTGSGSSKVCTGATYTHKWTQPSVTAPVGYTNRKWTAVNPTPTVLNNWTAASTNPTSTWTGCVSDRTQPNDTTIVAPTSTDTMFPANQYYENSESYCATGNVPPLQPIMPLSYDWTALKATITAMQPTGGTNQAIGLAWAWQSLAQAAPLNAPVEDPNYTYKKAIILLSDGLNTEDRWPANGDGSQQFNGSIDARQTIMCDNIKAAGITIYTIQVDTSNPPDPVSTVLSYCASGSQNFYMLYSASQVVTAFNSIGTSLSKLRVAR
jgi:Flp pilus assembly protein TadG